ncbi:hypothetical protein Adt_18200 [Abeliophyllum distichum]|uniref:Uncharacterized protein n=1 Tax=Abeliophyllum distichum TaxID=126358 RepID=A0ABD1TJH4_9LAMI
MVAPKRALEDEGDAIDFGRVKRGRMASLQEFVESIPTSPRMIQGLFPDSFDWTECINIGFRQDELDLAILEKLQPLFTTIVASVHKYCTSIWARTAEDADLLELIKME